jgi:hypothetical protein
MTDGKHCPACGQDIGIWAVLFAGLPSRIRCPHCRARLSYGGDLVLVLGVVAVLALTAVGAYHLTAFALGTAAVMIDPIRFWGIAIAEMLALAMPLELALTLLIRRHGVLKHVK